jgi:DNA-binding response OmpR family regulator
MDQIKYFGLMTKLIIWNRTYFSRKNYSVTTCNNGRDAIDIFENDNFDIVFLDENMPGMSGLETLSEMKEKNQLFQWLWSLKVRRNTSWKKQ